MGRAPVCILHVFTTSSSKMSITEEQLREIFDSFDKDNDQKIDQQEVMKVIRSKYEGQDCADIAQNVIEDGDKDGDGKLTFEELKKFFGL